MRRDEIAIELPCSADWDTMTAAGRKRFCADCKKYVHDLSRMKEDDAKALLETGKDLCVRYVYDEVGNVVFDIDVRASALVRAKRFAKAAALVALPMSLTACMGTAPPRRVVPPPAPTTMPAATSPSATPSASAPIAPSPSSSSSTPVAH
jgi:hypothetical protein